MQQSEIQVQKPFFVRKEILCALFDKYLEKISEAQWQLLAAGTVDLDTQAIILEMITEIIQTLSTDILRTFLPLFQEYLARNVNQAVSPEMDIKTDLGDALSKTFSHVLNVEPENNDEAEELTKLAEEEIDMKVNSLLSAVTEDPHLSPDSSVYVCGFTSNVKRLGRMVFLAVRCLRSCIVRRASNCVKTHVKNSKLNCEQSAIRIKSNISITSATESIKDILLKWGPNTTQENENSPPSLTPSCKKVASEILSTILESWESNNLNVMAERKPRFNLTRVVNKVRNYFGKCSTKTNVTEAERTERQKKCRLSGFIHKTFNKMMEELKKSRRTNGKRFFLNVNSRWGTIWKKEHQPILVDVIQEKPASSFCIISSVENFMDKILQSGKTEELKAKLENIKDWDEVQTFSRELVDKLYGHLVTAGVYKRPIVPPGKSLSDFILPKMKEMRNENQAEVTLEELYVMTEDAAGKFLQQILLLLFTERWDEVFHNEDVSGALSDITTLLEEMTCSHEDQDTKLVSTVHSKRSSTSHPPLCTLSPPADALELIGEDADDRSLKGETIQHEKSVSQSSVAPDKRPDLPSKETTRPTQTESSPTASQWKVDASPEVTKPVKRSSPENQINSLLTAFLLQLFSKYKHEGGKSILATEMEEVIRRLSHLVLAKVDIDDPTVTIIEKNLKDIAKALVKYLLRKFGSREAILVAIIKSDSSFDETVLKCLEKELYVRREAKKKGRIASIFSAIGNILKKPVLAMIRKPA